MNHVFPPFRIDIVQENTSLQNLTVQSGEYQNREYFILVTALPTEYNSDPGIYSQLTQFRLMRRYQTLLPRSSRKLCVKDRTRIRKRRRCERHLETETEGVSIEDPPSQKASSDQINYDMVAFVSPVGEPGL
jgi:hypothetical protein